MPAVFISATKMQNVAPLLKQIATALLALVIVLYIGDYVSVRLSRDPTGTVQVTKLYAVLQKNGKTEYEEGDAETQTCVNSIFPHLGYSPCWYLRKHKLQQVNL
jgi:hypothetical protein